MSTPQVNRLLDMVVEEVSLVDRAANKRRFLVVKRSADMPDPTDPAALDAPADPTATPADPNADPAANPATDADPAANPAAPAPDAAPADDASAGQPSSPLDLAVAALDSLTCAVETLRTIGVDDELPGLGDAAAELLTTAMRLAELVGIAPEVAPDGGSTPDGRSVDVLIASARDSLSQVNALLEAGAAWLSNRDAGKKDPPEDPPDPKTGEQVAKLSSQVEGLSQTNREQQQRLAALEKRFGLPASTPKEEPPRQPEAGQVEWPLDLNAPRDRASVDKSVSFHDL